MKIKKIPLIIELILLYLVLAIIFITCAIFLRNFVQSTFVLILIFLILLLIGIYIPYVLVLNPLIDLTNVVKLTNEKKFGYSSINPLNKEMAILIDETNKLCKDYQASLTHLKEKLNENESYFAQYNQDIETRKQLVASISHEIKTPLAVIEATASAILDGIIPQEKINEELENIINETDNTNKMLQEIVSVYKLESSKIELKTEYYDLKNLVSSVLNDVNGLINKYNQNLEILSPLDLKINVNVIQMKRVINNILVNALTYSPRNSKVTIELIHKDNYSVLEIINYNILLSPSSLNHVFDPFYREDKAREKKEDHGNGLGLYLVKEILEKHNLDYGIVNVLNGVKFYIIFPQLK